MGEGVAVAVFGPEEWLLSASLALLLTLFGGLMSGLTLGLLSQEEVDLETIVASGTPTEQKHARRVLPLIRKHHMLLVTLLLANAAAMEALPLTLDRLHISPLANVIISVTLVLCFGEVLPQAVCSKYALQIGSYCSTLVWALVVILWPIVYPISKLLDAWLGKNHRTLFRRSQLRELVNIHRGQVLGEDEVTVIRGALDLPSKNSGTVMTPLDSVVMLEESSSLDSASLARVVESGHSRIPVYRGSRQNIIGILLVKSLVGIEVHSAPVGSFHLRRAPKVPASMGLYALINEFQLGESHLAIVVDDRTGATLGIVTLEDVLEEILGEEIVDETDKWVDAATHKVPAHVSPSNSAVPEVVVVTASRVVTPRPLINLTTTTTAAS